MSIRDDIAIEIERNPSETSFEHRGRKGEVFMGDRTPVGKKAAFDALYSQMVSRSEEEKVTNVKVDFEDLKVTIIVWYKGTPKTRSMEFIRG